MKNLQLTSHKADEQVVIAFFCAVFAAVVGFCIKPPNLEFEPLRLFDATLCALVAIAFWGMYHCFEFDRFVGRKAVAAVSATAVLWVLAITLLMIALHSIDSDYSPIMVNEVI